MKEEPAKFGPSGTRLGGIFNYDKMSGMSMTDYLHTLDFLLTKMTDYNKRLFETLRREGQRDKNEKLISEYVSALYRNASLWYSTNAARREADPNADVHKSIPSWDTCMKENDIVREQIYPIAMVSVLVSLTRKIFVSQNYYISLSAL